MLLALLSFLWLQPLCGKRTSFAKCATMRTLLVGFTQTQNKSCENPRDLSPFENTEWQSSLLFSVDLVSGKIGRFLARSFLPDPTGSAGMKRGRSRGIVADFARSPARRFFCQSAGHQSGTIGGTSEIYVFPRIARRRIFRVRAVSSGR